MRLTLLAKSAAMTLFCGLFAAVVCAQTAADADATPGSVAGMVVDGVSGSPLSKTRLLLRSLQEGGSSATGTSDAQGRFVILNLAPGRYRLYAERSRYARSEYGQKAPGRPGTILTVQAGRQVRDIVVGLTRAGVITGRVVDDDGEPLERVGVSAMGFRYVQGKKQLTQLGQASTNDWGEYRIFGLEPGRYFISVNRMREGRFPGGRRGRVAPPAMEIEIPIYYPGVAEVDQAVPVDLVAGAELQGIDVQTRQFRTARITGTVIEQATGGATRRNTALVLLPRNARIAPSFSGLNRTTTRGADGAFEISGVLPGSYTLVAQVLDRGNSAYGRLPVEIGDRDIQGLTINVSPGVRLQGSLRIEGDVSLEGARIRVGARPLAANALFAQGGGFAMVDADGDFVIGNVPPETFYLQLSGAPEDFYLKTAQLAGQDVLSTGLDPTSGIISGRLELTVSPKGGRFSGSVVTEGRQPFAGASVVLVPEKQRRQQTYLFKSTTTDQSGVFTLRGISPGKYEIFAWEAVESGAWEDPDFLRDYEGEGRKIEITEGSSANLELKLIPFGESAR